MIDAYDKEERIAIMIFDGGLSEEKAKELAGISLQSLKDRIKELAQHQASKLHIPKKPAPYERLAVLNTAIEIHHKMILKDANSDKSKHENIKR